MVNETRSFSGVSIIPKPVKISLKEGKFFINTETIILSDSRLIVNAEFLKNLLIPATGFSLVINDIRQIKNKKNTITLSIIEDNTNLKSEGYTLEVTQDNVNISALTPAGVFYGIQTLRQLLPPEIESAYIKNLKWSMPCVKIVDYPRFSWRGFMLDEARHFFGKEIVKRTLELMALLKLNIFHWHLTDDQGWRIEIKKYPLLTEIGSKRKGTYSVEAGGRLDGIPVSGYYSQEDLKEIIDYAAARHIIIIPEIDVPGHVTAALASYPEFSCTGGHFEVSPRFGIHKDVLCVGKDSVFNFVQNILNELIKIFPSEIIHVGGDEVKKRRWKKCPKCQTRMKTEGFESEDDLQTYFTNKIANYLSSRGRRLMGWNEILNENLDNSAICHYWTNNFDKVLEHARNGRNIVMSERTAVYLDYPLELTPLKRTYEYDPMSNELEGKYHDQIFGLEGLLWSEHVPNVKRLDWQIFPRLIAIAETGWTPKKRKNFNSFQKRLEIFLKRLDFHDINYAKKEEIIK
ncbi:MAG: beta-N-acetylhexosaminidase [Promethearchaeota archaeon]